MDDVVNSFNDFFVNIGPNLAEKIPVASSSEAWNDNLTDRDPSSMFLTAVDEKEIIDIVNNCKYKTSTDCNEMYMIIVKKGH